MTILGCQRVKKGGTIRYEGVALTATHPTPLRLAVDNEPPTRQRLGHLSSRPRSRTSAPVCPGIAPSVVPAEQKISESIEINGAQGRNRTTDTVIFSHVLYQLSYLGLNSSNPIAAPKLGRYRDAP